MQIIERKSNYMFAVPIIYHVQRVRDGKSFATRKVDAIQKGNVVFTLFASFQVMLLFHPLPIVNISKILFRLLNFDL